MFHSNPATVKHAGYKATNCIVPQMQAPPSKLALRPGSIKCSKNLKEYKYKCTQLCLIILPQLHHSNTTHLVVSVWPWISMMNVWIKFWLLVLWSNSQPLLPFVAKIDRKKNRHTFLQANNNVVWKYTCMLATSLLVSFPS